MVLFVTGGGILALRWCTALIGSEVIPVVKYDAWLLVFTMVIPSLTLRTLATDWTLVFYLYLRIKC